MRINIIPSYARLAFGLSFLLSVFAVLVMFAVKGQAQDQGEDVRGFTVSPLVFELSANPGDTLEQTLKVDNNLESPIHITVARRNFVALGEEGQPDLTEESTSYSLAPWMSVSPSEVDIPAKGSQTFKLTIKPPVNAEPGGHFGSVVFQSKPGTGSGNVSLVQEIGALVLLKIAGEIDEQASIDSFEVSPTFSQTGGPFEFALRVKNSGNVHIKPISTITITNMFGKEVVKLQLDSRNVLPDSVRKFTESYQKDWMFGRHTATVTTVFGTYNKVLVSQITFWAFPLTLILVVLGGMIVLGVIIYLGRRRIGMALKALAGKEPASPSDEDPKHAKGHSQRKRQHKNWHS